jgi:hypothetical protein
MTMAIHDADANVDAPDPPRDGRDVVADIGELW